MERFPTVDDDGTGRAPVPSITVDPPTSAERSRSRSSQQHRAGNTHSTTTTTFPTITTTTTIGSGPSATRARTTAPNESRLTPSRPALERPHSIRLKRLPSSQNLRSANEAHDSGFHNEGDAEQLGRRRSMSEPQWPMATPELLRPATRSNPMESVAEESSRPQPIPENLNRAKSTGRFRSASDAARKRLSLRSNERHEDLPPPGQYESEVVDLLDVVDPEVSTLTTLTNVQNSLFVPDLGRFLNRRPTYELSRRPTSVAEKKTPALSTISSRDPMSRTVSRYKTTPEKPLPEVPDEEPNQEQDNLGSRPSRTLSITSVMTESRYAVLPHGVRLEGWTDQDMEELNDHVRHMLHSRRSKFKRGMKAFGKYIKRPLGFFVTLYATLITLFGLAWVLFLIGWINVGGRQLYMINVIDNVLVALFAIVGDCLAPFRAVDTYHMCYIAHYHHLTWRLRREQALPKLQDHNDLPAEVPQEDTDVEAAAKERKEFSLLSETQQKKLEHHQTKFSKSHSFYKPHETTTHHAFPLRLLVAVVVLLDCHSLFQIALGACTWGISYHHRPGALTAVILCCSICCNIMAGILISVGDRKSRKKEVVKQMFRQELTEEAMNKVRQHKSEREGKNLNVTRSDSESDQIVGISSTEGVVRKSKSK